MTTIRIILYSLGIFVILFALFLAYCTVKDYKPEKTKTLAKPKSPHLIEKDTLKLMIWNIGYSGLGEDMSFFYDGGEEVRTSKKQTLKNLEEIENHLKAQEFIDFILLQEVDKASKRSYYINEYVSLKKTLTNYNSYFAINYKVPLVPVPLFQPLGKVSSGLACFSAHKPKKVIRHKFPGNYKWPKNLFMLDRCFLVLRNKLKNGKELLVINTHNSAYDDGALKEMQMKYLKKYITKEYNKGNFIIVGGDWNQFPPGIATHPASKQKFNLAKTKTIAKDYMPKGWKWAYDPTVATNRSLNKPLNEQSDKTLIDFYLLSPNIESLEVKTQDLKFKYSDHQPVYLYARLK